MIDIFICPVCGKELLKSEKVWKCSLNHSFDISKEGYVNLLTSDKMNSKSPGDNREMVKARTEFLNSGFYDILSRNLNETIYNLLNEKENPIILDAGCGEGYYTDKLKRYFECKSKCLRLIGIDISKEAVKKAAKRNSDIDFAVASAAELPVKSESINLVISNFSMVFSQEFKRILKSRGYLIAVQPGERHLYGLKEILYEKPYLNESGAKDSEGFKCLDIVRVKSFITISDKETIDNLFKMTPYFYNSPEEGYERLQKTDSLETEIDFEIIIYKSV